MCIGKDESPKHWYDATVEMALIFMKFVPLTMFWMYVLFGFLVGTDELQRNLSIATKSFFTMSFAAVAGTVFFHRLGLRYEAKRQKQAEGGA